MSNLAISMLTKKDWRTSLLGLRNQLSHSKVMMEQLALNVLSELKLLKPRSIGAYWPIRSEPNFNAALKQWAWESEIVLYLPETRVEQMVYRRWEPDDVLQKDRAGIWCATGEEAKTPPDLILAPCVGYSNSCYRLGYGGGFFDRYLSAYSSLKPIVIGVCFDQLLVPDDLFEVHDAKLDLLITERKVLRNWCSSKRI